MRRRILTMLAAAMFVAGACGGTASPSASAPASAAAPSASAAAPSASASAGIDLAGSSYKAEPATKTGGTVIMAEWQSVTTMNPYYASANADIEASAPSSTARTWT